jgi:hypothetical protein
MELIAFRIDLDDEAIFLAVFRVDGVHRLGIEGIPDFREDLASRLHSRGRFRSDCRCRRSLAGSFRFRALRRGLKGDIEAVERREQVLKESFASVTERLLVVFLKRLAEVLRIRELEVIRVLPFRRFNGVFVAFLFLESGFLFLFVEFFLRIDQGFFFISSPPFAFSSGAGFWLLMASDMLSLLSRRCVRRSTHRAHSRSTSRSKRLSDSPSAKALRP